MNCRQTRNHLPLFVGGDLPFSVAARVEEHLLECPDCHEEFERYEDARRSLFRLKGAVGGSPPDLWPAIRGQLAGPPRRSPLFLRRFAAAVAVLLVFALGTRLLIPSPPTDSPPPNEAAERMAVSRVAPVPAPAPPAFQLDEATLPGDAAMYETAPALTTLDPERGAWDEF